MNNYDIFLAEVLWENGDKSIVEVPVPKEECFECALVAIETDTPVWITRQAIVEKYLQSYQKLSGCQGGIVLHLVDNDKKIIDCLIK